MGIYRREVGYRRRSCRYVEGRAVGENRRDCRCIEGRIWGTEGRVAGVQQLLYTDVRVQREELVHTGRERVTE